MSKNGGLSHILKKYSTYRQKGSSEVLPANYTDSVKILVHFEIKPRGR